MSAKDAYIKAGYKSKYPRQQAYKMLQRDIISQLIEEKKSEISRNVDDQIALAEEEAFIGILTIGRNGENDFAKLKAWQDILDRRRGKAKQAFDVGGTDIPIQINIKHVKPDDNNE